jgi:hypothetical protein
MEPDTPVLASDVPHPQTLEVANAARFDDDIPQPATAVLSSPDAERALDPRVARPGVARALLPCAIRAVCAARARCQSCVCARECVTMVTAALARLQNGRCCMVDRVTCSTMLTVVQSELS